jgi:hypothetical protein
MYAIAKDRQPGRLSSEIAALRDVAQERLNQFILDMS